MKKFFSTLLLSLFTFNSFSFAAVDPMSLVGQYRLGDCTQSGFTSVVVSPSALTNAKGLKVDFYKYSSLAKSTFVVFEFYNTINLPFIQVLVDSFTITNIFYTSNTNQTPVLKSVKLGRSASGGRARLVEANQFGVKTFECVFYK